MTAIDPDSLSPDAAKEARKERLFTRINTADKWLQVLGLSWVTPVLKAAAGDNPKSQVAEIWKLLGVPVLAIAAFLALWASLAPQVQTSLGAIPGPAQVWEQAVNLHEDAQAKAASKLEFEAKVAQLNERRVEQGKEPVERAYTGAPSYYAQIWTSIQT
ncbi:MAG: ABC transporter permease, partial [Pseudomonadota bacterium]